MTPAQLDSLVKALDNPRITAEPITAVLVDDRPVAFVTDSGYLLLREDGERDFTMQVVSLARLRAFVAGLKAEANRPAK